MARCPACGFDGLDEEAWDGDCPSDDICPCCGIQFGYEDAGRRTADFYGGWRTRWVSEGMRWWSGSRPPPPGWSGSAQVVAMKDR